MEEDARTEAGVVEPLPHVILDTCALLDVVRAPVRGKPGLVESASALLGMAQSDQPLCVLAMPEIAKREFDSHLGKVREESCNEILKLQRTVVSLRGAAAVVHVPEFWDGAVQPERLVDSLTELARRLATTCWVIPSIDALRVRAHNRMMDARRPARNGKGAADCEILEVTLDFIRLRRAAGNDEPAYFVSSNTKDYCDVRRLHPDLHEEFEACSLEYFKDVIGPRYAIGRVGFSSGQTAHGGPDGSCG